MFLVVEHFVPQPKMPGFAAKLFVFLVVDSPVNCVMTVSGF
jgi:hypothetical protein